MVVDESESDEPTIDVSVVAGISVVVIPASVVPSDPLTGLNHELSQDSAVVVMTTSVSGAAVVTNDSAAASGVAIVLEATSAPEEESPFGVGATSVPGISTVVTSGVGVVGSTSTTAASDTGSVDDGVSGGGGAVVDGEGDVVSSIDSATVDVIVIGVVASGK